MKRQASGPIIIQTGKPTNLKKQRSSLGTTQSLANPFSPRTSLTEKKNIDVASTLSPVTLNLWSAVTPINIIPIGTGAAQRIGQKIQICAIQFKADFNYTGVGGSITVPQRIRIVLLKSEDCSATNMDLGTVYGNVNGSAGAFGVVGLDLYNRSLYQANGHKVLHDELVELDQGFLSETVRVYKKMNTVSTLLTGAGATYDFSNIQTNGISVLFLPEVGAGNNCSSVRWVSRISYYDD